MNDKERNDLQLTISHALQEMEAEAGDKFDLSKVNRYYSQPFFHSVRTSAHPLYSHDTY